MPLYARVENGAIIEERNLDVIPPHKANLWTPIVIEGSGPLVNYVIEANQVRRVLSERPLAEIKAELISRLKTDAARIRDKYRTPGKDLVYAEKKDQAVAVLAMGETDANALPDHGAATFPLLAGTVGIEAQTLYALAQLVWTKYEQWNALSYVIERNEIGGSKTISDASDAASARAAYEAITWPV